MKMEEEVNKGAHGKLMATMEGDNIRMEEQLEENKPAELSISISKEGRAITSTEKGIINEVVNVDDCLINVNLRHETDEDQFPEPMQEVDFVEDEEDHEENMEERVPRQVGR
ncbi:hypothetical protein CHUAL_013480 [Chamberlinius hualienensis]